jgi:hypothetical protein
MWTQLSVFPSRQAPLCLFLGWRLFKGWAGGQDTQGDKVGDNGEPLALFVSFSAIVVRNGAVVEI